MYPVLIKIGMFPIRSWGILVLTGIFVAYYYLKARPQKELFKWFDKHFFYIILWGIIGARIYQVLFWDRKMYFSHPLEILKIWNGGMAIQGTIIAVVFYLLYRSRKDSIPFFKITDFLVPAMLLGHAIGRIGCFLNGDSYGRITNFVLGVHFPGLDGYRHPTQLYEAALNFLGFLLLNKLSKKKLKQGTMTALYLIYYGTIRFFVQSLRADTTYVFGISAVHAMSVAFLLTGLLIIITAKSPANLRKGE